MNSQPGLRLLLAHPFRSVLALSVLIVVLKAAVDGVQMHGSFAGRDNDDIMRLLTVRDWIAGQGWYDVVQYRLLPPEGVPLHWSRYIDVGIAAIIVPFSWFLPMETAEQIAAILWPTLILLLTIFVIGFGTQRVFGKLPACFAVLCVTFWPLTASLHAAPGNLDHHNVQLLMMTLLAFAVIWPSRPVAAGVTGGIAAAFSLAIGLESLPFIVGGGFAFLMRALFVGTPMSRRLLVVFCITLFVASVLLMMGQTAPSRWAAPVCDQLGTPTLSLVAIAAIACIAPMAARPWLTSTAMQLGATIVLTAIGVGIAWPLLSGCLDGPYGDLPVALQDIISGQITEAKPGLAYFQSHPGPALIFTLPVIVSLFLGAFLWAKSEHAHRAQALGLLLILGFVGFAMVFVQMRTVIMTAAVVPIIGGVVVAYFLEEYLQRRNLAQGLIAISVAALITSPAMLLGPVMSLISKDRLMAQETTADCKNDASLSALNSVPPGVVLTHINFGPALIWATHHQGLSAPYHRSAAALANGILPFTLEETKMAAYVRDAGATHLLLCRGYNYNSDFADALAAGETAAWLGIVALDDDAQLLFEVLPE